jgi:WD40 repeat protein
MKYKASANLSRIAVFLLWVLILVILAAACGPKDTILPTAGPLCEAAASYIHPEPRKIEGEKPQEAHRPSAPVVTLIKVAYKKDRWDFTHLFPDEIRSTTQARTLVCITQSRTKVGTYTSGGVGYRPTWTVKLVSYPDGAVLGSKRFVGGEPAAFKSGAGDAYGDLPDEDLVTAWVTPLLQNKHVFYAHWLRDIALSPNGTLLAMAHGQGLTVWDIATEGEIYLFEDVSVSGLAFSPDGQLLAGGTHGPIGLWDLTTGAELPSLAGHEDTILSLAFSPDGRYLASGSKDGTAKLWDVETGQEIFVFDMGPGPFGSKHNSAYCVVFVPDGGVLATGSEDGRVRYWDIRTGDEALVIDVGDGVMDIAFSPDGTILASGAEDGHVRLWDASTGERLGAIRNHALEPKPTSSVAFSPDGLILAGNMQGEVVLWDALTTDKLGSFDLDVEELIFFPQGRSLAVSIGNRVRLLVDLDVENE